jgi:hypothetical protein
MIDPHTVMIVTITTGIVGLATGIFMMFNCNNKIKEILEEKNKEIKQSKCHIETFKNDDGEEMVKITFKKDILN